MEIDLVPPQFDSRDVYDLMQLLLAWLGGMSFASVASYNSGSSVGEFQLHLGNPERRKMRYQEC